jgi:AcrR family transcriptional regulator
MKQERTARWERRSDARPAELIAAGLRLFAERGFAATRLEDVAAAAGVSKATVYLYFESKSKLFEAVVRAGVVPSVERAEVLVEHYDGSTQGLLRMLVTFFESALEGPLPSLAKLVLAESGNFPELAKLWGDLALKRVLSLIQRIIARGIERGELRDVDPQVAAPLIIAPLLMMALFQRALEPHVDFRLDRAAILQAHVETVLFGLSAPHGHSASANATVIRKTHGRRAPKSKVKVPR